MFKLKNAALAVAVLLCTQVSAMAQQIDDYNPPQYTGTGETAPNDYNPPEYTFFASIFLAWFS